MGATLILVGIMAILLPAAFLLWVRYEYTIGFSWHGISPLGCLFLAGWLLFVAGCLITGLRLVRLRDAA